jgi:hypothetical protein
MNALDGDLSMVMGVMFVCGVFHVTAQLPVGKINSHALPMAHIGGIVQHNTAVDLDIFWSHFKPLILMYVVFYLKLHFAIRMIAFCMCLVLFHDRGMGNLFSLTAFFITRIRWLP